MIVNTSFNIAVVHLWDLSKGDLISRVDGHKQTKYLLRGALGGFNQ